MFHASDIPWAAFFEKPGHASNAENLPAPGIWTIVNKKRMMQKLQECPSIIIAIAPEAAHDS